VLVAVLVSAAPALADECFNASKNEQNPLAGDQVVFDAETEDVISMTNGLANRVERGIVDPETGEGFHGIIGAEHDGGFATSTFLVTPDGHIPETAQFNGSPDHGIINVCDAGFC
jgi:hypothetical protein